MHPNLFHVAQVRPRRMFLMLLGSVLFHGTLIGIAYLWPYHPANAATIRITDFVPLPSDEGPAVEVPPSSTPAAVPAPAQPPIPPEPQADPLPDEVPPPEIVPDVPALSTPPPITPHRPVSPASAPRPARAIPSTGRAQPGSNNLTATHPGGGNAPAAAHPGNVWKTNSKPPYPYSLQTARVQGSGSVRLTTDTVGRVLTATIAQSTGNTLLDENTCRYARGFWSGPPNATTTVSFTYRLP